MIQPVRTIKYIVKHIDYKSLWSSPIWFLTMHIPYIIKSLFDAFTKPYYKNIIFTSRIYDGFTSNDFKNGNLIQFLYKIRAIEQPTSYESSQDCRGYFIGYKDDE